LAVRGLALLHVVSGAYPEVIYSEFYNDALNEYYMHTREGVRMEYRHWIKDRQIIQILKTKALAVKEISTLKQAAAENTAAELALRYIYIGVYICI
jgi:hypothetical protein